MNIGRRVTQLNLRNGISSINFALKMKVSALGSYHGGFPDRDTSFLMRQLTSTNDCERLENDIAGFFTKSCRSGNNEETRNRKTRMHLLTASSVFHTRGSCLKPPFCHPVVRFYRFHRRDAPGFVLNELLSSSSSSIATPGNISVLNKSDCSVMRLTNLTFYDTL